MQKWRREDEIPAGRGRRRGSMEGGDDIDPDPARKPHGGDHDPGAMNGVEMMNVILDIACEATHLVKGDMILIGPKDIGLGDSTAACGSVRFGRFKTLVEVETANCTREQFIEFLSLTFWG